MAKKDDGGMTPLDETTGRLPLNKPSDPEPTYEKKAAAEQEPAPDADGPQDEEPAQELQGTALRRKGAEVQRHDFEGGESQSVTETASSALAEQARAEVSARFIMALKRPRDLDVFRQNLLKDCERPGFARMAEYAKPIGEKKVRGASIRFIEAALRHYGNVMAAAMAIYDDPLKRIVRVTVTDLETNFTIPKDVTIEKTVERSKPRDGEYLSRRKNSYGKWTYLVPATEDDMLNKENSLVSKAMRTNGERLLPADIKEEALEACRQTVRDAAAKDPDADRRSIADGFFSLNVDVADLKAFLGHDLDKSTPAELANLRAVYVALREGQTTWQELMDAKEKAAGAKKPGATKAESLIDKLGGGKSSQPSQPSGGA